MLQAAVLAACVFVVAQLLSHFPHPSPLIKPLLGPRESWPTEQIMGWVEAGSFPKDFLEFFARDPERTVPGGRNLVAPADGVIQGIVAHEGVTYFIVGLSFWDVHVVRTPVSGVVKEIEDDGSYYPRDALRGPDMFLKGKPSPVQKIVTLETEYGEVKVRLITSYWASRLKVWVKIGDRLEKGQRVGRILLGSTVIVDMPGEHSFVVKPEQRVVAGETIIMGEGAR